MFNRFPNPAFGLPGGFREAFRGGEGADLKGVEVDGAKSDGGAEESLKFNNKLEPTRYNLCLG